MELKDTTTKVKVNKEDLSRDIIGNITIYFDAISLYEKYMETTNEFNEWCTSLIKQLTQSHTE